MKNNETRIGSFFSLFNPTIAIIFFASSGALNKEILTYLHPFLLALYTKGISIVLFFLFLGLIPEIKKAIRESHHKRISFFLFSILDGAIAPLCLYYGLQFTTAIKAGLLVNTYSLFLLIFAIFVFKEKVQPFKLIGMFVLFIGVLIIIFEGKIQSLHFNIGDALIILAQLIWVTGDVIFKKYLRDIHPDVGLFGKNVFAFTIVLIISLLTFDSLHFDFTPKLAYYLIFLAIFPVLVAQYLWLKGIQTISGSTLSLLSLLQPVLSVIFASLILGEQFYSYHIVGAIFVLSGLFMSQITLHKDHVYHQMHHIKHMHK